MDIRDLTTPKPISILLFGLLWIASWAQQAVHFTQPGAYLEVPHHTSLATEKMTLEFWLKIDGVGETRLAGEQTVFDKRMDGKGLNVRLAGTDFPLPVFAFYDPGNEIHYFPGVMRNRWNHFAYTFAPDSSKLYVNGRVVNDRASGDYDYRSTAPLRIGEFLGYPGEALWLRGQMDEIRWWNTVRSSDQIQEFMHKKLTGNENNLQLYLNFESNTTRQINDLSRNKNHAQIIGSPLIITSTAPVGFIPLPPPPGFRTSGTEQGIQIEWDTLAQAGSYKLYRSTSPDVELNAAHLVQQVGGKVQSYTDKQVTKGRLYYYVLVAVDKLNNEGAPSNVSVSRTINKTDFTTGVYYYPWYIPEENHHQWPGEYVRDYFIPKQPPALGEYSSANALTIRQHLQWMQSAGIDFMVSSWWGPDSKEDVVLKQNIWPEIEKTPVKFAIYYESALWGINNGQIEINDQNKPFILDHFDYLSNTHFKQKNYLTINNKPVVFIYLAHIYSGKYAEVYQTIRAQLKSKGIEVFLIGDVNIYAALDDAHTDVLDGLSPYIPLQTVQPGQYANDIDFLNTLAMANNRMQQALKQKNKLFVPNIFPGFNNLGVRGEILFPRQLGPNYSSSSVFENMIKVTRPFIDPDQKMVMITSWNEWHEDSQIEPTIITAPTSRDNSAGGANFTRNYPYEGYGTTFLELADRWLGPASTVAVHPLQKDAPLSIYPNPVKAQLQVLATKDWPASEINIMTIDGKQIIYKHLERLSAGENISINVSKLFPGIYILSVQAEKERWATKVVVTK